MPSWGPLASLGYTHPPELLISFGPLASLTPGPHQNTFCLGNTLVTHHDSTQIPQTLPECDPHSEAPAAPVDWLRAAILSVQEKTGILPTPAEAPRPEPHPHQTFRRPIPACNTHGGSDSPTDYHPCLPSKRAGVWPWYNCFSCSEIYHSC